MNNASYELLKKNRKIGMLDIYNIEHLIEHTDILDKKIIINIDYQTVLSFEQLYEYLKIMLALQIRLDFYNSQIGDEIWENTEVDYIKFDNEYWNKAMHNNRVDYSLRKKVDMFMELSKPIIPMFDLIKSKDQHQYIERFKNQDIFVNGDYYAQEKVLELKKLNESF